MRRSDGLPGFVRQTAALAGAVPDIFFDYERGLAFFKSSGSGPAEDKNPITNTTGGWARNKAGVWVQQQPSWLRRTDAGASFEELRQNKCTNYNASPPALVGMTTLAAFNTATSGTNVAAGLGDGNSLFGIVDDAAEIAAAGLQNFGNGRVFKIDNTAGAATAQISIGGATGNTNAHSLSVFWRGTGNGNLRLGGVGAVNYALAAAYARKLVENTSGGAGAACIVAAPAGSVVYFILNQMEEGASVTSPIVVAGAAATRNADVATNISIPTPGAAISLAAEFVPETPVDYGTSQAPLALSDGTNNERVALFRNSGSGNGRMTTVIGGVTTTLGVTQLPRDTSARLFARFASGDNALSTNGGAVLTSAVNLSASLSLLTVANNPVGSTYLRGTAKKLGVWLNYGVPNANLQAWTGAI